MNPGKQSARTPGRGRSVGLPPFGAWYHFIIKSAATRRLPGHRAVVSLYHQVRGDSPPARTPGRSSFWNIRTTTMTAATASTTSAVS